jgi:hypothetical protein
MFTLAFIKGAGERAIKTGAQTALAFFVIGTTGLLDLDWVALGSVAGAAVVASLLTSISNPDFVAGPPEAIVELAYEPEHRAE